jgi:hypothetical protein
MKHCIVLVSLFFFLGKALNGQVSNDFFLDEFQISLNTMNSKTPQIFKPILDSTISCSWYEGWSGDYELEFFYIVEHMPKPKIPIDVIENILGKEVRFNAQEKSYNDTIGFQCVVNCNGEAGDFQILKCPDEFVNIACQILIILRTLLAEWDTPIQRGVNVDLLALIAVKIDKGQFEVIAPVY